MMHRQKDKKIFIYVLIFFLLGTLNNKYLSNFEFLKINKIHVSGLSEKENLEIIKKLNFLKMSNLLFLDDTKTKNILKSYNKIEEFYVFKKYPNKIEVKVNKTNFLAITKKNGKNYFLGSNGKLIETKDMKNNIPFIFGSYDNKEFLNLYNIFQNTKFDYKSIKNLFSFPSGRWDIEMNSGVLIKLPKENLKDSIFFVIEIMNDDKFKNARVIDIRQKNQLIINEQ